MDSLADAEQFVAILAGCDYDFGIDWGGLSAGYSVPKRIRQGHKNVAARLAREAAHAAFRAVPALREPPSGGGQ